MRADMAKVLTERPRTKSWEERRKTGGKVRIADLNEDLDDEREVSRLPISRRRVYYDYKDFTDHIMPLKNYLRAQVGRPWNDVWSDLCATLDRRTTTGNHVFEHIAWEVETNTVMVGSKVHEYVGGRHGTAKVTGLYVHPVTGILEFAPYPPRPRRKKDETKIRLGPGRYLISINGIWYEGTYERFEKKPESLVTAELLREFRDPKTYWGSPHRVIEEQERRSWDERRQLGSRVYFFHRTEKTIYYIRRTKRQLSTKELRRHGIENHPTIDE